MEARKAQSPLFVYLKRERYTPRSRTHRYNATVQQIVNMSTSDDIMDPATWNARKNPDNLVSVIDVIACVRGISI